MNIYQKNTWKGTFLLSAVLIGFRASTATAADGISTDPCEATAKPILAEIQSAVEAGNEVAGRAAAIRYWETRMACMLALSSAAIAAEKAANAAAGAVAAAVVVRIP